MFNCWFCDQPDPPWVGVRQMANLLHLTEQEVRRRCRVGLIPDAEKVAGWSEKGQWRVPTVSAVRYYQEVNGLL